MKRNLIIVAVVFLITVSSLFLLAGTRDGFKGNSLNVNDSRVDKIEVTKLKNGVLEVKYYISESAGIKPPFEQSINESLLLPIEEKIGIELYLKGYEYQGIEFYPFYQSKKLKITIY